MSVGFFDSLQAAATKPVDPSVSRDTVAVVLVSPRSQQGTLQTWANALAHPLVVAVIVFFLGRSVEQWVQRRRRQKNYEAWIRVVADEVHRNLRLLAQTDAYLWVGIIPSYSLSLFAPTHAFRELSLLSRHHSVLNDLFGLYYEYQHIQDRLSELLRLHQQRISAATQARTGSASGSGRDPLPDLIEATRSLARNSIQGSFALHSKLAVACGQVTLPRNYLDELHREFQAAPELANAPGSRRGPLPGYVP